ncbi:AAA family ATPase [Pseudanabaena sp. FACHB-1277]|uniref:AAA family ATPase n=1 Tax=Pseudanabaena cinerea FACHB-1277 TaxID=2949581 RepID=A0A926Z782_9CYAN|nr:AAA family ATPase [Pseudanabaena cinerea]MBD2151563.1 AAA family ATPase [Pseudanabaena cinerea FACHB-1277]
MKFNPDLCRNESEVESKLFVQFLLPTLGYDPSTWHQEVAFGNIRLDFLAFTSQVFPQAADNLPKVGIVMEAKHPKQNLDFHVRRLTHYLTKLQVCYGVLSNGKDFRIYELVGDQLKLSFRCDGMAVADKIDEIKDIISRDKLRSISQTLMPTTQDQPLSLATRLELSPIKDPASTPLPLPNPSLTTSMKTIAIYHNKGGVGKTTTVVNLAAALSKKGKRVLVIDLDSQANTTFATGLIKFEDEEFDDIKELNVLQILSYEDSFPISEVARKSNFCNPSIDVVPAHISLMESEDMLGRMDSSRMILMQKLKDVESKYDIVLIDTPPSLNLYARVALIACDYLIIPSDLKPYANQGLVNVKEFIKKVNGFRKQISKPPVNILGVLPNKISTNSRFVQYTLPNRLSKIEKKYDLQLMNSIIYDRDELAKCGELTQVIGDIEVADPKSIFDFKPDAMSAQEFELLSIEILEKIGVTR